MKEIITVLVVDDSAFMRMVLCDLLAGDEKIKVVGTARNGVEAIEKVKLIKPDVVTMDIEMPELDGMKALRAIMREAPTRVVMLSGASKPGLAYEALRYGAVDFIGKPSGQVSRDLKKIGPGILRKIHAAARAELKNLTTENPENPSIGQVERTASVFAKIVAIGASTGGPQALERVFKGLPANFPAALVIVQHLPAGYSRTLAERLTRVGQIPVREAVDGDPIKTGQALLAPGDRHMVVTPGDNGGYVVKLEIGQRVNQVRPSIDPLMLSVAETYGNRSVGVILSGMGADGLTGMEEIKRVGGHTIVQNKETCVVFGMPKAVVDKELADQIVAIDMLAPALLEAVRKKRSGRGQVSV